MSGAGGYHVEKGRGPRPLGGYWMRIYGGRDPSIPMRQFMPTEQL